MTNYYGLHLENIEIPGDYLDMIAKNPWENHDHPLFHLTIQQTPDGICYECDVWPFADDGDEMRSIRHELDFMGYIEYPEAGVNGHGWAVFLETDLAEYHPDLADKVTINSEANVCELYVMDSLDDFKTLLGAISEAVRGVLGAK